MVVTVDRYTRFLLTIIVVLLTVVAAGLWMHTPSTVTEAYGIVDSGVQLEQMISKMDELSVSVDNLGKLLRSGEVKVQIVEPEAKKKKSKAK